MPLLFTLCVWLGWAASSDCASCHKEEAASFAKTGMGRSAGAPQTGGKARFRHPLSNSQLEVDGARHRIERGGLKAEYAVSLRIGSGKVGSSFAIARDGRWFQSPISWYAQDGQFRISPGFEQEKYPDFDRRIEPECLACHAEPVAVQPAAIRCARCHGDGAAHAASPKQANIVNPARLTGAARDSVCEQCHLAGVARIANPGHRVWDFVAGRVPEDFSTTYVAGAGFRVTSHVEQLALSACVRQSGGRLWCGTCHNPHPTARRPERTTDAVCRDCHQPHAGGDAGCARCHMPKRRTSDVVHAAYTDHFIRRKPENAAPVAASFRPWRESPRFALRNRALGLHEWGQKERRGEALLTAFALLEQVKDPDPEVWTALGTLYLQQGRMAEAAAVLRKLVAARPDDAMGWLRLGIAEDAPQRFEEAVRRDPYLFEAWVELAKRERARGNWAGYENALRGYLRWMPQSLAARQAIEQMRRPQ